MAMTYLAGRTRAGSRAPCNHAQGGPAVTQRRVAHCRHGTLKGALDTWAARSLAELDVVYVYLAAIALKIRCAGKVGSTPVLAAVGVLADGTKQRHAL